MIELTSILDQPNSYEIAWDYCLENNICMGLCPQLAYWMSWPIARSISRSGKDGYRHSSSCSSIYSLSSGRWGHRK